MGKKSRLKWKRRQQGEQDLWQETRRLRPWPYRKGRLWLSWQGPQTGPIMFSSFSSASELKSFPEGLTKG